MSELKEKYMRDVAPGLREVLCLNNALQVPRLSKVVLSVGVKATDSKEVLDEIAEELGVITGQKALITKAKKSISNFKLREGVPIGAKVTLRRARMYDFLERLIDAALPLIRDFRGLSSTGFDGHGNYSFGVDDQSIFPELDPNDVKQVHGLNVTIVTTARDDAAALKLLKRIGMPLAEQAERGDG